MTDRPPVAFDGWRESESAGGPAEPDQWAVADTDRPLTVRDDIAALVADRLGWS